MRVMRGASEFPGVVEELNFLSHEVTILQLVIAGYFKFQLSAKARSSSAAYNILDVVKRLRELRRVDITNPDSLATVLDQEYRFLTLLLVKYSRPGYKLDRQFLYECQFRIVCLGDCYSRSKDFEAADKLFQLRNLPFPHLPVSTLPGEVQIPSVPIAEELFQKHLLRRQNTSSKPRVRPWIMLPEASLSAHSRDVFPEIATQEKLETRIQWLCRDLAILCRSRRILEPRNGSRFDVQNKGAEAINLEAETDSDFGTISTASYRYGVTLSDSGVPGMDLSKYIVH